MTSTIRELRGEHFCLSNFGRTPSGAIGLTGPLSSIINAPGGAVQQYCQ